MIRLQIWIFFVLIRSWYLKPCLFEYTSVDKLLKRGSTLNLIISWITLKFLESLNVRARCLFFYFYFDEKPPDVALASSCDLNLTSHCAISYPNTFKSRARKTSFCTFAILSPLCLILPWVLFRNYKCKHGKRGQNLILVMSDALLQILLVSNKLNWQTYFYFCWITSSILVMNKQIVFQRICYCTF